MLLLRMTNNAPVDIERRYADDSTDKPSRHQVDFLRNIVREAERQVLREHTRPNPLSQYVLTREAFSSSKMVNVADDEPFQFHAAPYSMHGNDSSLDASSATPSPGSDPFYEEGYEHSPDSGGRRGRPNSRRRRWRRPPLIHTSSQHHQPKGGPSGSGTNGVRNGSGSGSSDTRRPGHRSSSSNGGTPRGRRRGDRASRSSSLDGGDSLRSGDSGYLYDPTYENSYGDGYGYDDDDRIDPDEEAHIRRLRGPKLNVRILPLPAREIEIAEEEERIRREEEAFALAEDGEITPVQGRISVSLTPKTQPPEEVSVQPLSPEDHDAVSQFVHDVTQRSRFCRFLQIVALSDALWKALEDGLRISEPPKVIHRWED